MAGKAVVVIATATTKHWDCPVVCVCENEIHDRPTRKEVRQGSMSSQGQYGGHGEGLHYRDIHSISSLPGPGHTHTHNGLGRPKVQMLERVQAHTDIRMTSILIITIAAGLHSSVFCQWRYIWRETAVSSSFFLTSRRQPLI